MSLKGYKLTKEHKKKLSLAKLGKKRLPFTEEHKKKIGLANKGKTAWSKGKRYIKIKNPNKVSYVGIHSWLIRNYGKANMCVGTDCTKKSQNYDYALIKGKRYKRLRNVFIMLCRSCHIKYDYPNNYTGRRKNV